MHQQQNHKQINIFPIPLLLFVIGYAVLAILAERNVDVIFQFPEYDYKESSKNVRDYWFIPTFALSPFLSNLIVWIVGIIISWVRVGLWPEQKMRAFS